MAEAKIIAAEDAHDAGVWGTIYDTIDNEAYTVSGQGPETARREREQLHELRHDAWLRSQEREAKPAKARSAKASASS